VASRIGGYLGVSVDCVAAGVKVHRIPYLTQVPSMNLIYMADELEAAGRSLGYTVTTSRLLKPFIRAAGYGEYTNNLSVTIHSHYLAREVGFTVNPLVLLICSWYNWVVESFDDFTSDFSVFGEPVYFLKRNQRLFKGRFVF